MKAKNTGILKIMRLLSLLAMIGYAIEAGSAITSFIVSFFNPAAAKNIYNGLGLHTLKEYNQWLFYIAMLSIIIIAVLKSTVWYHVMKMLTDLNLSNPFQPAILKILQTISYILLTIWIMGMITDIEAKWLTKNVSPKMFDPVSTDNFLFMAGLVFIIAQVFKRGIELQSENDLTV